MTKIFSRLVILVVIFFSTWWLFYQVDWMRVLKVNETTNNLEEKFGELMWELVNKDSLVISDTTITRPIDRILKHICKQNSIDVTDVNLHIIKNDEVNAFALPDNYIIIYSGLIKSAQNQEELSGVICHELAHLELNHVMKKLVKEIGLSVIISATTGSTNSTVIIESLKHITSTAYDRSLEQEADMKAVDYLLNAAIDPEQFANFLYTLTSGNEKIERYSSWLNTHPYPKERAQYILEYFGEKSVDYEQVIADSTWRDLQTALYSID